MIKTWATPKGQSADEVKLTTPVTREMKRPRPLQNGSRRSTDSGRCGRGCGQLRPAQCWGRGSGKRWRFPRTLSYTDRGTKHFRSEVFTAENPQMSTGSCWATSLLAAMEATPMPTGGRAGVGPAGVFARGLLSNLPLEERHGGLRRGMAVLEKQVPCNPM